MQREAFHPCTVYNMNLYIDCNRLQQTATVNTGRHQLCLAPFALCSWAGMGQPLQHPPPPPPRRPRLCLQSLSLLFLLTGVPALSAIASQVVQTSFLWAAQPIGIQVTSLSLTSSHVKALHLLHSANFLETGIDHNSCSSQTSFHMELQIESSDS